MLKEFRDFVLRGNVLDLAVAVIVGAAFGAVINSLVNDIIMPPIGMLLGGVNFSDLYINLSGTTYPSYAAAKAAGAAVIGYGAFINTVISLIIVGLAVFLVVKAAKRLVKEKEAATSPPSKEEELLTEIRDLLKSEKG